MKELLIGFTGCLFLLIALSNNLIANNTKLNNPESATIFKSLSGEPIKEIWIKTSIDSLLIHKRTNKKFAAFLSFTTAYGEQLTKSITLKPRGKSRRKYCDFPPLRMKFDKKELLERGWSDKHKSLKLVTHCNEGISANQNILKEYLAYQIYNELTNSSLKIQLLKINYEDIHTGETMEKYGLLLEDIDELAERLNGKEVEGFNYKIKDFERKNWHIFSVFQFLIGNTDYEIITNRNVKFILPNIEGKMKMIPYDFDSSGFVAPSYAKPDVDYQLKSLQQRLFLGKFKNSTEREEIIKIFQEKQPMIYSLVKGFKELDWSERMVLQGYLDSFYKTISHEALLDQAMPLKRKTSKPSDKQGEYHFS